MARKYTRKALREPDEFVSFSQKVVSWVAERLVRVVAGVSAAAVVIGGVSIWRHFSLKGAEESTSAFAVALDLHERPIVAEDENADGDATKKGDSAKKGRPDSSAKKAKTKDEPPPFKTHGERVQAVATAAAKVADSEGGSDLGVLAQLVQAATLQERGEHSKAAAMYQSVVERLDRVTDPFRVTALEGLLFALEGQKKWDAALKIVEQFPKAGSYKDLATFHRARLLASKGDRKGAAKAYRAVMEKASSRTLMARAGRRLSDFDDDKDAGNAKK